MSSPRATMTWNLNSNFNELRWVIQIRRTIDEDVKDDNEIPVSIFNVPKTLISSNPSAYIPHEVSLGPYHSCRTELGETARHKLSAAKRFQKQLHGLQFHDIISHFTKLEMMIRACYHKYLDFNGETLVWMMAIDASFILEFLQMYNMEENSDLIDHYARRKAQNTTILKDMVMLENQIPLFLLRKMLEFQFPSLEIADEVLNSMIMGLYKDISPFNILKDFPIVQDTKCAHLLDFFYQIIVPKLEEPSDHINDDCVIITISEETCDTHEVEKSVENKEDSQENSGYLQQFFNYMWELLLKLNKGPVPYLNKVFKLRPVSLLMKLPWMIIVHFPGFAILRRPIECFFSSRDKEDTEGGSEGETSSSNINTPPLIEEIMIPSVTELHKLGVQFLPSKGGINTLSFDKKRVTLYLPVVRLDVHTEVILRNLVAYEASMAIGPLVFTRYTELMNGIIDTEEDAKLLRERGIVLSHLKSDKEVSNLWNGMSQSVRLTRVPFLDKVIEDVNKYHGGHWKVKVGKLMKSYVFGSWQFLTFLATIVLLVFMFLQTFCSIYKCSVSNVQTIK